MKQLKCELCESTDFVKQDGMFVCQSCGTKYSLEEAKKMMSGGESSSESPKMIENYMSMAKNALDAGNNEEAVNYCNKIIEVDPTSYEAWFIKGKAVGWQSTLGNPRIPETINAFANALDNCPDDQKNELGEKCKDEIESLHKALISLRMKNFMNHPNDNDLASLTNDVTNILTNSINFLTKAGINTNVFGKDLGLIIANKIIGEYNSKIWNEYQGDDGRPGDYAFKRFVSESDVCIGALQLAAGLLGSDANGDHDLYDLRALTYESMVTINTRVRDGCSWDYNFTDYGKSYYKNLTLTDAAVSTRNSNNAKWNAEASKWRNKKKEEEAAKQAEKARKEREEKQKRFDEYWAAHADEKTALEAKQKELKKMISEIEKTMNEQVSALYEEKNNLPGYSEIKLIDEEINKLMVEKSGLGMFKGKEKKALQDKIDQLTAEKQTAKEQLEAAQHEINIKIERIKSEANAKMNPMKERVSTIRVELTKGR